MSVELRKNKIKHKLQAGSIATVLQGFMTSDLVDFVGQLGFDGVWLEAEHGPIDFREIPDLTRSCDLWGMTSIVRVNLNMHGVIYRTLDQGAQGIVMPHVNTADEARSVVDGAKFFPLGTRGSFTSRQGFGVDNYHEKANSETLLVVLIEDIVAVNNLSEILEVDNIDVFFVAPGDLAQTMGHVGGATHPDVVQTVDMALKKIVDSGRIAGTLVNDSNFEAYIDKGVRFVMTGWQQWAIAGAGAYLDKISKISV